MSKFSQSTEDHIREKMIKNPSSLSQVEKEYFDIDARSAAQSLVGRWGGRGGAFIIRAAHFAQQMGQELLAKEVAKERANAPQQSSSDVSASNIFGGDHE